MKTIRRRWGATRGVLIVAFCGLGILTTGVADDFYVAPSGSDSNPGTLSQPFRSIQRGATIAAAGDTCHVRAGTYRETVIPAHSGSAGARITFTPYNGESVTVSGAEVVTGWTPDKGSIYKSQGVNWDLGTGRNQIFVDGRMMPEARWPNTGPDVSNPAWAVAENAGPRHGEPSAFIVDSHLTQPDGFWNGATVVHQGYWGWWSRAEPVTNYTRGRVELQGGNATLGDPTTGTLYWLVGKLEALDANGEWFKDASGLYLWTPQGDNPSGRTVEAKKRFYAFDLSDRSHIAVKGFRLFASAIKTNPNTSHVLIDGIRAQYTSHYYGGGQGSGVDKAGTYFDGGDEPRILLDGDNNTIQNCEIAYSAGSGVVLRGSSHKVNNCVIHDVNYGASESAAIYMNTGPGLHHITYNTLYNSGRSLLVHYNVQGLKILHNHMYNAGLQTQDLGITYTHQTDGGGTEIAYNWLHDNKARNFDIGFGPGVYLDGDRSSGYLIHHNVIWNTPAGKTPSPGIFPNGNLAHHQKIYNNTIWNTGGLAVWKSAGSQDVLVYNNLSNRGFEGTDLRNNLTTPNPGFVDAAKGNFQLLRNSPAVNVAAVIPGITDGFVGPAPDAGAYEFGAPAWTAGASLASSPPSAIKGK